MPNYRGIEQEDLLKSINDMLEILETHSSGPESQARIDKLRVPDAAGKTPLGLIAAATDDKSLSEAMRVSGVDWVFSAMRPLLEYHALTNTDSKGLAAVAGIHKWDGAGGALAAVYTPLDAEMDYFLTKQYAAHVDVSAKDITQVAEIASHFASKSDDNEFIAVNCTLVAGMLSRLARSGAPEAEFKELFDSLDPHERYVTLRTLTVLNVPADGAGISFDGAFSRYCVEVPELTAKKIKWTDSSVATLRDKVEQALMPFYELDEVRTSGIGGVNNWTKEGAKPLGIIFDTTARGAQAVADAGFRVLDSDGNLLAPRFLKQPKVPGRDL